MGRAVFEQHSVVEIKKDSYAALFLLLTDGSQGIVSGLWMNKCNCWKHIVDGNIYEFKTSSYYLIFA